MADEKISALSSGSPIQDTDEFVLARSGDNKKVTGANIRTYGAAPISIAIGDVATATDLIDGQLYSVTGLAAFTSTVQLTDLRFYAYKDTANIGAVPAVMSSYGIANYSQVGVVRTCEIIIDWYGSGNVEFVKDYWKNEIEGFANIDIFPFDASTNVKGNKVGAGFTLDITALTTEKFNDNTCYGNGTFTAVAGRDYEGIDFTKKYFAFDFQFTYDGSGAPSGASINILKNELGEVPTILHSGVGEFRLTGVAAGVFGSATNKCSILFQHIIDPNTIGVSSLYSNDTRIDINIWDTITITSADLPVSDLNFRVQVYF